MDVEGSSVRVVRNEKLAPLSPPSFLPRENRNAVSAFAPMGKGRREETAKTLTLPPPAPSGEIRSRDRRKDSDCQLRREGNMYKYMRKMQYFMSQAFFICFLFAVVLITVQTLSTDESNRTEK